MVLYLDRICQCGLHAVLWSHIGTLMHRLAAERCSAAGHLFPSRCPSGTILSLWNNIRRCGIGGFQEQGQCFFIGLSCSIPILLSSTHFPFLFFLSICLYCGGLRTDRVYITLSQPCTADPF